MGNRRFIKYHKNQKGSSILESMIAILLLCLIFFGIMQVFHFAMTKLVCNYAAFNGGKALSLGYTKRITDKTIRLSALGASGNDLSEPNLQTLSKTELRDRMQLYMSSGNANVQYSYWDPMRSSDPELTFRYSSSFVDPNIKTIKVVLENAPMLDGAISNLLQIGTDQANPSGEFSFFNFSSKYLESAY